MLTCILWLALARVPPLWLQPDKTSSVVTLSGAMRVLYGQDIGRANHVSYPLHLFEQRRFRVRLFWLFFQSPDRIP